MSDPTQGLSAPSPSGLGDDASAAPETSDAPQTPTSSEALMAPSSSSSSPSSSPNLAAQEQLERWRALHEASGALAWRRRASVAGELFIQRHARRWARVGGGLWAAATLVWVLWQLPSVLSVSLSDVLISLTLTQFTLAQLALFVSCSLLWPKLFMDAGALRRMPHADQLITREPALMLLEQRRYRDRASLKTELSRGFGPTVLLLTPPFLLGVAACGALGFAVSLSPVGLILGLSMSWLFFGILFWMAAFLVGSSGIVAWSAQRVFRRLETIGAKRTHETLQGSLALTDERAQASGGLSMSDAAQVEARGRLTIDAASSEPAADPAQP